MTDKKWQLQPNGLVVRAGSYAIRITSGPMGQSHTAQVADLKRRKEIARLISAAPELLEALESLVKTVEDSGLGVFNDEHDALQLALKAIRKAKGGDA